MKNTVDVTVLDGIMDAENVAKLPPEVLYQLQDYVEDGLSLAKKRATYLTNVLDIRYRERADEIRKQQSKDTGTVRVQDNDFVVVAEAPKQVHWDRDKLADILDTFDPDTAKHFGKWTLTVEERKFSAATPEIQDALQPARTVSIGKTKYRLEPIMEPLEKTDAV
jgi:hypothetical protein